MKTIPALDFVKSLDEEVAQLLSDMRPTSPALIDSFVEQLYGDLYQAGTLTLRERFLITIAALACQGDARPQFVVQCRLALKNGLKRGELQEVVRQVAIFGGYARALRAANLIHNIADDLEENA
jgi:4-carboxymuconolactone decarboxylase